MSDLMMDGVNLAMYGMGFVFIFLILLVFLTTLMSRVVRRYAPLTIMPSKPRMVARKQQAPVSDSGDQARVVAVVTAAIRRHRANSGDD